MAKGLTIINHYLYNILPFYNKTINDFKADKIVLVIDEVYFPLIKNPHINLMSYRHFTNIINSSIVFLKDKTVIIDDFSNVFKSANVLKALELCYYMFLGIPLNKATHQLITESVRICKGEHKGIADSNIIVFNDNITSKAPIRINNTLSPMSTEYEEIYNPVANKTSKTLGEQKQMLDTLKIIDEPKKRWLRDNFIPNACNIIVAFNSNLQDLVKLLDDRDVKKLYIYEKNMVYQDQLELLHKFKTTRYPCLILASIPDPLFLKNLVVDKKVYITNINFSVTSYSIAYNLAAFIMRVNMFLRQYKPIEINNLISSVPQNFLAKYFVPSLSIEEQILDKITTNSNMVNRDYL